MHAPSIAIPFDPNQIKQRARELLAQGLGMINALGSTIEKSTPDPLLHLENIAKCSGTLMDLNLGLAPLISDFKQAHKLYTFKLWFTGAALENQVYFEFTKNKIHQLFEQAELAELQVKNQITVMQLQVQELGQHLNHLSLDLKVAHLLLSPQNLAVLQKSLLHEEHHDRLLRRVNNLEAMHTAQTLNHAQFKLAIQHAYSVCDRYYELRNLLLPIWKQHLGFELISSNLQSRD